MQPKDILHKIMLELAYPDLMKFCLCSKTINNISDDERFWNRKALQDYLQPLPSAKQRYCNVATNNGYCFGSLVTKGALKAAIRNNESEIFKYYIHKCPKISDYIYWPDEDSDEQLDRLTDKIIAYTVTCCRAWTSEEQRLLELIISVNEIHPSNLTRGMHNAIASGNLNLIKYLMNCGVDITTLNLKEIAKNVIKHENIDVISYCLLMNLCPRDDMIEATISASKLNLLKFLIDEDDPDEMEYVLIKATEYNAFEIFCYALNYLELTEEIATNVLKWATNNGNMIITEHLLNIIKDCGIKFEKEPLIGFINLTCKSGSREMLKLLLNYAQHFKIKFNSSDLNIALNWIISRDNPDMLELFLSIARFDMNIILGSAARAKRYNIINYLKNDETTIISYL